MIHLEIEITELIEYMQLIKRLKLSMEPIYFEVISDSTFCLFSLVRVRPKGTAYTKTQPHAQEVYRGVAIPDNTSVRSAMPV